jgi:alpha-beta hydrolase superfamily lysophospholipase
VCAPGVAGRLPRVSTRVLPDLPPRPRPPPPVARHHRVHAPEHALHVVEWPAPEHARHAALLLPGAGAHAATLGVLASELRARGVRAFGLDPPGHGASDGPRGGVDLRGIVAAVDAACAWAARAASMPVALVGAGLGGEWALHAHLASAHVRATVAHAPLLSSMLPLDARVRLLRSPLAGRAARLLPRARIPLSALVDPSRAFLDESARRERAADPLALRAYQFAAWRSFFTVPTAWPPPGNHKPVLVVVGERDELVPPSHALRVFMALGGPKAFHVVPGAAHHLALENAPALADAVAEFLDGAPA